MGVNFFGKGWISENVIPFSKHYSLLFERENNRQFKRDRDVFIEITSIEKELEVISSGLTDVLHRADSLLEKHKEGNKNG